MRADGLTSIKPLQPPVVPPRDPMTGVKAKVDGVTPDGQAIYVSHVPDMEKRQQAKFQKDENGDPKYQRRGPDGELVYRTDAQGEKYPVLDIPPFWKEERFILVPSPRGHVRKMPFREPTEEEVLRNQRKSLEGEFLDRVMQRALERGLSPEGLVDRILSGEDVPELEQPDQEPAGDVDEEFLALPESTEFPHHKGGGYWYLSDGSIIRGKKDEAIDAQAQLLATVEF